MSGNSLELEWVLFVGLGSTGCTSVLRHLSQFLFCFGASFRLGRQEDAHEYLVALLDAMHEALLSVVQPKPSHEEAQTSAIYRIFGGVTVSQVCPICWTLNLSVADQNLASFILIVNLPIYICFALQRSAGALCY